MKGKGWKLVLVWVILMTVMTVAMQGAMFMTASPQMKDASFLKKIGAAELSATLEYALAIPANRLANSIMSAAQVGLGTYVFDFIGQIATNRLWLKVPTTVDDYAAMGIIMLAMYISVYKIFT
tara:strand:- start:240 stop:608 length:369 start_codon:yes stop_codon:yes gene_type:complete